LAQEKYLRDVPDGHYAYDAVHDLLQRDVTNGFPDGTYRGKQEMTRFEIAAFISKLARSLNRQRGTTEKLVAELRSEIATLTYTQNERSRETTVDADLLGQWRAARTPERRGGRAAYRLRSAVTKRFSELASLRINLDTMDTGYDNGDRDLVRELLDFTGTVKIGPGELQIAGGPGDLTHTDDGFFPGENGIKYRRPRRSAAYSARLGATEFALTQQVRSTDPTGLIGVEELSLKVGQDFGRWQAALTPRSFSDNTGRRENRFDLSAELQPLADVTGSVLVGLVNSVDYPHGLYLRGELNYRQSLRIVAQRIGARFRETFSYSLFDIFDRGLPDGATNLGVELGVGSDWFTRAKGDWTTPGNSLTTEWHLGKNLDSHYALQLVYQTYNSSTQQFCQALGLEANIKL
jgi:hypothetical protein